MNKIVLGTALFIGLSSISSTCSSDAGEGTTDSTTVESTLPESFTDLEIEWSDGGGMLNQSQTITIGKDECVWAFSKNGNDQIVGFTLDEKELNELYQYLRENEFDKITSRDGGEVMDRGGIEIRMVVDGTPHKVDNSGSMFVNDEWIENWRNVNSRIQEITQEGIDGASFEANIFIDKSISDSPYNAKFFLNNTLLFNESEKELTSDELEHGVGCMLMPTLNEFEISLTYKDSVGAYGGEVSYKWIDIWEEMNHTVKGLTFSLNSESGEIEMDYN